MDRASDDHDNQQLATNLARAAGLLQADSSVAAQSVATGMASSAISSSVGEWLNQFGTARVALSLDNEFKADGSSLDMLLPLYDNGEAMLFTQFGYRNKDSRNTLNIGTGVRTFHDNWMFGVNVFHDHDLTGKNRRIGLGGEAWTDYVKLSANSYFGLTDWQQSRDYKEYDERPADGWDIRAEGWLPAYPQLGGKLIYEKYRGNEVALFGKDERQKNPHAMTVGINWTPFPLLTLGAEHKAGSNGKNDSHVTMNLTVRPGDSLAKHFDTDAVAATRTLAGVRTDLVERNNNIVLEYRKQEILSLSLPEKLEGETGTVLTVHAKVKSKYGLSSIDWQSPQMVGDGGKLTVLAPDTLAVTLPPQVRSEPYVLSGVARDTRGNVSERRVVLITVNKENISAYQVTKVVNPNTLPADGQSVAVVSLDLKNAQGQAISGRADNIISTLNFISTLNPAPAATSARTVNTQKGKSPVQAAITKYKEVSPGIYEARLTAGTGIGMVIVSTSLSGTLLKATANVKMLSVNPGGSLTSSGAGLSTVKDGAVA
ncbi:hypothetical protein DPY73_13945, partial [Salmonella enterica subsp. enterica]|nr:hypothetical protein [Salmonella enterica subsp. enterica serovar Braenderup]